MGWRRPLGNITIYGNNGIGDFPLRGEIILSAEEQAAKEKKIAEEKEKKRRENAKSFYDTVYKQKWYDDIIKTIMDPLDKPREIEYSQKIFGNQIDCSFLEQMIRNDLMDYPSKNSCIEVKILYSSIPTYVDSTTYNYGRDGYVHESGGMYYSGRDEEFITCKININS